ncbi:MAG TPA: DinB family protein [Candidatus Limnocylindria bacterium]|nr:DinB family protein [Candidatus Limnocylindria bacterium]
MTDREALLRRYREGAAAVDAALAGIADDELDRAAPDGGWTARQVAHHLADSEAMAYTRLRRLVADADPVVIQGYDEPRWAERLHYDRPIGEAVAVVHAVRAASAALLEALTPEEWQRSGTHSEGGAYGVMRWLEIYAEHPHEHAAQIRAARGAR